MSPFSYKTIDSVSEGSYKEKGSRFLGFAIPVAAEADIKQQLDSLRKKFFDARHHCYAYRLGVAGDRVRSNDDGEPNHSAGDPILGQIRSRELTNILVVVVRYFGGVKLGVGGLVAAYKAAAHSALDNARIVEKEIKQQMKLHFHYEATADVMRLVGDFQMKVVEESYQDNCAITVEYSMRDKDELMKRIQLLTALKKINRLEP